MRQFSFNGRKALESILQTSEYGSIHQAIASLTCFSHPLTVRQTQGKNIFPIVRYESIKDRGNFKDLDNGLKVMQDDNKGPTDAFLWANNIKRTSYQDIRFNHIWDRSKDVSFYTSLANICVTPEFIAKLTDNDEITKSLLRYRVFQIYEGFKPEGCADPEKPDIYDKLKWADPLPLIENLENRFREEMRTKPRDRTTKSAREIGWYFSGYIPDPKL